MRTSAGDSVFYAGLSDTVTVDVSIDSDSTSITGFELFLAYDPTLFLPIDTNIESPGNQPARSAGVFGQVFADSVIIVDGSTSVAHFAEVDLIGGTVSGTVFSIDFIVIGRRSGMSDVRVLQDLSAGFSSLYTPSDGDGETVTIPGAVGVVYQDLPPTLSGFDSFTIEEDGGPAFLLRDIADDEGEVTALTFDVSFEDSSAGATQEGDSLRFVTVEHYNGQTTGTLTVRDAAGGEASTDISLIVIARNDPPEITRAAYPDTVVVGEDPVVLPLSGTDVDDVLADLLWFVLVSNDSLSASKSDTTVTLTAVEGWNGSATLTLQLADPGGEVDILSIHAIGNAILGDFDRSGDVGFTDFLLFAGAFGNPDADPRFDLDGSGLVDFPDFLIFAANFGT